MTQHSAPGQRRCPECLAVMDRWEPHPARAGEYVYTMSGGYVCPTPDCLIGWMDDCDYPMGDGYGPLAAGEVGPTPTRVVLSDVTAMYSRR